MNEHKPVQFKELGQVPVTQDQPLFENTEASWTFLSRLATVGIFVIVAIGAFYLARSILMPVFAAIIIGITLSPVQKFADRYGLPPIATALALVVLFCAGLWFAVQLVAGPTMAWVAEAPELGAIIKEKLRLLERPFATLREVKKALGDSGGANPTVAVETSLAGLLQQIIVIITPAVSELIVFFGTLLFFLVGTGRIRKQLIFSFGSREARLRVVRIWNDIENNLVTYLSTVTAINLGLGVVTALMLYLLDFPNPIAFGVLACVLNYVPYIGPAIVVISLALVGLVSAPELWSAAVPPLLFVAVATVEGHFITPSIVGRRLTLSPFMVFLALAFWTWLWGPLGAFMATPLLIVGLVVLGHLFPHEETVLPG